ncbi:glycoside hydrolase family 88 protein [Pedobacter xixiisoli]|uniref:Glycosyl Hydrolase Family 88 n=1 Tax=Pedobacter xixiisoli TaxID=1476464 RepID=A0A285ZR40_9SPHI|nr:glycoside hydrolase family 88 protein [Pedobacter xixiisoli]SOD12102.1 Glycosyl Hydrolase Family 88 [Pedobacter xixiisoli]
MDKRNHLLKTLLIVTFCFSLLNAKAQTRLDTAFINQQLNDAVKQIKVLATKTPEHMLPRTFDKGKSVHSETGWWTSGFYPGTLLYLYEYSNDKELLQLAQQKLKILEKEQFNETTHDLGFMLYCSFGNAMRITGDTAAYRNILLTGAKSLATRFSPITKAIRSWDFDNFPVIIDNMMNLEFLTRAARLGGDKKLYDIAVTHANTTMKNHYRKDMSCYHVVDYYPKDGSVIKKKTNQGAFDESAWARGQAWGLYGYTMMYRETGDKKYLKFANKIAKYILQHPNMPKDLVPYWDFDAPNLADTSKYAAYRTNRDVSTASLMASAFLEMSTQVKGKLSTQYFDIATNIIKNLSSSTYKAALADNGGYLLKYSVGNIPAKSEIDVPLTYADYYYVEALLRYKRLLDDKKMID